MPRQGLRMGSPAPNTISTIKFLPWQVFDIYSMYYKMIQSPAFFLDRQFRSELDGIKHHCSLVGQMDPVPKAFKVWETIFCEFCFALISLPVKSS